MYYRAHVINKGGEMPRVSCLDCQALLKRLGINNIAVEIFPTHWHIIQVGGYSRLEGLFCHCC